MGAPTARRLSVACLVAAGTGVVLLVATAGPNGTWLPSYLFVWLFVLSLSMGSLPWVAVHNLTGGDWGRAVLPAAGAALGLLPLCALLGLPLLHAPAELLPWMRTNAGEAASGQQWYLNVDFFYLRAVVYFTVWIGLAWLLRGDRAPSRSQALSAVSLVLYALTVTFAAVDWTMSLTPRWHSTVFGLLIATGQVLAALALAVIVANALATDVDARLRQRFHDLGNLSLALVMVWAYLGMMQFLIIWVEDLPEEIPFYLVRSRTSWSSLTVFVALAHFALPFVLLLSRGAKRAPAALAAVAALILLASLADSFWLVVPTFRPYGFALQWSDLGALLAIGGLWLGGFAFLIGRPAALHGLARGPGDGTQHA